MYWNILKIVSSAFSFSNKRDKKAILKHKNTMNNPTFHSKIPLETSLTYENSHYF